MHFRYPSAPFAATYGDLPPDSQSPPPAESAPPDIQTPAAVETPPPSIEELLQKVAELEKRPTSESLAAREAELMAAISEGGTKFAELQTRYHKSVAERAIADAANAADAINPKILLALLASRASVEGDQVVVEVEGAKLTPAETIARMKEVPDFWHLFKGNVVAGIGGNSGADMVSRSGGRVDLGRLTSKEYRELRRTNPAALGLDRKPKVRS